MARLARHLVGESGVIVFTIAESLDLRHLHMVEVVSIKGAIASMLNGGLGAGKKPPPLPTRSLASHFDDKTVVVDCESLTAAVPSVVLDLGREIVADASSASWLRTLS